MNTQPPYSEEDYKEAKKQGYDLDNWDDYCKYFELGEEPDEHDYFSYLR